MYHLTSRYATSCSKCAVRFNRFETRWPWPRISRSSVKSIFDYRSSSLYQWWIMQYGRNNQLHLHCNKLQIYLLVFKSRIMFTREYVLCAQIELITSRKSGTHVINSAKQYDTTKINNLWTVASWYKAFDPLQKLEIYSEKRIH